MLVFTSLHLDNKYAGDGVVGMVNQYGTSVRVRRKHELEKGAGIGDDESGLLCEKGKGVGSGDRHRMLVLPQVRLGRG